MADALPAWSLPAGAQDEIALPAEWPDQVTREWAYGRSDGAGVRVCILDSGVAKEHPLDVAQTLKVVVDGSEGHVEEDEQGDSSGHGTACAGILRSLAPACSITSVRILGGVTGSGVALLEGLRWAIDEGFALVNMSLSTTKRQFAPQLHELADRAYFRRTMLVASAHNMPVESFPWRFSSVISVGSHEEQDPLAYFYNPDPPVEFFARGVGVEAPWIGGGTVRLSGNSFATPHITAICALILGKHGALTPFQLKSVLYLTARNVTAA